MPQHPNTLLIVSGPTASGKTTLSIELAKTLNTHIISADSRQFYREMKTGTAAPNNKQLEQAPHHFTGHLSIHQQYDVYQFEKQTLEKLKQLFQNHQTVLMTGGSGLYVDAVCKGIDDMPNIPNHIRENVNQKTEIKGTTYLKDFLKLNDPKYYEEVDKNNPLRMKRGVEVFLATGKPFSSFRKKQPAKRNFNVVHTALLWNRETLNQRIHQRTTQMINQGWLEEAKKLYPYRNLNALKSLGYKELFLHLEGKYTLEEAIEKIKTQTRRYAKRQMTWLRKNTHIKWIDCEKGLTHAKDRILEINNLNR